jgi:hypothetical protein
LRDGRPRGLGQRTRGGGRGGHGAGGVMRGVWCEGQDARGMINTTPRRVSKVLMMCDLLLGRFALTLVCIRACVCVCCACMCAVYVCVCVAEWACVCVCVYICECV